MKKKKPAINAGFINVVIYEKWLAEPIAPKEVYQNKKSPVGDIE